jgi:hypothetical protein
MKIQNGPLDGAQSRAFVLSQLQYFGVKIEDLRNGSYELEDLEGDVEVLFIDDPVVSQMITYLWRRFGQLHGMVPSDIIEKKAVH